LLQSVPPNRNLYKILGERTRAEQTKTELTQDRLAEKAGFARNYIGNIELAEHKVTLETLECVAKALILRIGNLKHGI
jgi:transcriptional regulator with XRE-family HTH domain